MSEPVKYIYLSTVDGKHTLSISNGEGTQTLYAVNANQILLLAYQTLSAIWSHYRLVPRD